MFLFRRKSTVQPKLNEIDVQEARRRQTAGAVLIDVREDDEWAAGHADGARHVPLGQIGASEQDLPRDREVLLICRSGRRSAQAAQVLLKAGHSAVNVAGGMQAWTQAGLPAGG
jgi:rhodanese-related sulfurtransferase